MVDPEHDASVGCTIEHHPSWRRYEVQKSKGDLVHREFKRFSDSPNDIAQVNELPVKYVMGSGAFANGYLLNEGDYLLQSPVTWYAKRDDFAMAPGYDKSNQVGLSRMIDDECLFCHAGLVSRREDNPRKPEIHELAIGCERCHGPGQAHTDLYQAIAAGDKKQRDGIDSKIVNPTSLDRLHLESVCAQCHLQGDVVVHAADRSIWDFRPGEDISETRLHYKNKPPGDFEKVFTGHFDQLWQSRCYTETETLTCVTCHDSHHETPIDDLVQYRREQCSECHQESTEQSCPIEVDDRISENSNNCVACHMPSIDSEVPHSSTTSHLIAVYRDGKPEDIDLEENRLRRLQPKTTLTQSELNRRDQLARLYNAVDQTQLGNDDPLSKIDVNELKPESFEAILFGDNRDAETYSLIARIAQLKRERVAGNSSQQAELGKIALQNARRAIELEKRPVRSREAAVELLGTALMESGQPQAAVNYLIELSKVRRVASDAYNLALALAKSGRVSDAESLFREAIRIDGSYAPAYRSLAVLYRSINPELANRAGLMSQRLSTLPNETTPETANQQPAN
ncbi:hypothetical protein LOC67_26595 [Stieleria sp. JC731]|uniref:hypothetical protein n=1 Tax=Pirellulaceae TaxID=2691357 RepID=UPI001E3E46A5|nr:hypothetical protein [Stieleria sp. JC731]MCC9604138.1 hypothetical protein [Stieleria sp. JC731]